MKNIKPEEWIKEFPGEFWKSERENYFAQLVKIQGKCHTKPYILAIDTNIRRESKWKKYLESEILLVTLKKRTSKNLQLDL